MGTSRAHGPARPGEPGLSGFRIGLLVLVVATAAWRGFTSSRWSWFADDWVHLEGTQTTGFLAYVFEDHAGDLVPGQRLLTWLLTAVDPLGHGWAAVVLTLLAVGSLVAWALALREVFGERTRLLVPLTLLALSPLLLLPGLWWSAGTQVLAVQLAMGLCVLFAARHLRRGEQRTHLVLLLASYVLGLCFGERGLLVLLPLALVAWVLATGTARARVLATARVMALPVAASAAYAVALLAVRSTGDAAATRDTGWRRLVDANLADVTLPTLFGGPFRAPVSGWDGYAPLSPVVAASLTVVLLVLVVAALVLRRHSGTALAALLACTAAAWVLGMATTPSQPEPDATGRWFADVVAVVALVVALLTTRTVREQNGAATRRTLPPVLARLGAAALGAVACAVVVAMVVTNASAWRDVRDRSPRPWVDAVVADATRAGDAAVVNAFPPTNVLDPVVFLDHAALEQMLSPLDLPLRFDEPSELLLAPDATGRLKVAEVSNLAATNVPATNTRCGFLVEPGRRTDIPLTADLYPWGWAVRMDYFTDEPTVAKVTTDDREVELSLEAGLNAVQFMVTDSVETFRVAVSPGAAPLCVTQVYLGLFTASDASPWG